MNILISFFTVIYVLPVFTKGYSDGYRTEKIFRIRWLFFQIDLVIRASLLR